jgi:transcriptional regulator with XRE-family HTH domain
MRSDCTVVAEEIRRGRVGAGLSLRTVAQSAGIDHATLWRFERGLVTELTLEEIGAVGATVGLDIRLRAFPAGDPIRDAAQQRLLERLRALVHPALAWETEVPIASDGGRRAWDAMIRAVAWRVAVDAETALSDVQAVERRFNLKRQDGHEELVLLLLAETRRNRTALAAAPAAFAGLTRSARPVLAPLRNGSRPPASAVVFL